MPFVCRGGYCSPRLSAALPRLGPGERVLSLSLSRSACCSFRSIRVVNALHSSRLCFACCALLLSRYTDMRMRYGAVRYGAVRLTRYPLCYCVLSLSAWRYAAAASLQDQCRSLSLIARPPLFNLLPMPAPVLLLPLDLLL